MDAASENAGLTAYSRPGNSRGGAAGLVLLIAMLSMGLMAGLFYAFDISVMPGLARTDDQTFVTVMQRINEAIQNPVFAGPFLGAFLFTGAAAFLAYRRGAGATVRWILAALALYIVALIITMGVNVPLNDKLAAADDASRALDIAAVRNNFEGLWETANMARTAACILALVCLGRALLCHGRVTAAGPGG
jgi:uncharacterized membrane protein